ncbi:hypothetical protein E4T50_02492 [Aureobasidium sp. EXF-12298]|nr:hypothetical protein E4T50_02492 [Aureobasidium sp. EXF-12298]KAI4753311.1 hypothetical protein E4T51_13564 [Aureobasidium sp. EXF-12344]
MDLRMGAHDRWSSGYCGRSVGSSSKLGQIVLHGIPGRIFLFYLLNLVFPCSGLGDYDQVDVYETFTPREAAALGVVPVAEPQVLDGVELGPDDKKMEPGSIVEKFL